MGFNFLQGPLWGNSPVLEPVLCFYHLSCTKIKRTSAITVDKFVIICRTELLHQTHFSKIMV